MLPALFRRAPPGGGTRRCPRCAALRRGAMLSLALVALLAMIAPQRAGLPDGAALALVLALLAPAVAQAGIRLDLFRHRRRSRPAGRRSHKDIRR